MSKVVTLPGVPGAAVPGEPDPKMVAELRLLLEEAERGEIRSVMIAAINHGGHYRTMWAGSDGLLTCIGAVAVLQAEMTAAELDEYEPDPAA